MPKSNQNAIAIADRQEPRPIGVNARYSSLEDFPILGYAGPFSFFSEAECAYIRAHIEEIGGVPPGTWSKHRALEDRILYEIATLPRIVDPVRQLLGNDLVLWGVSIARRKPSVRHPWHVDRECSGPGFASVWIGLENTTANSSLRLIGRSHRIRSSVEEVAFRAGVARDDMRDETVLGWARQRDHFCEPVRPDMGDGDGIIFDGRLWHGSYNTTEAPRTALLFQFARPDNIVRRPDLDNMSWPIRFKDDLPAVLHLSGPAKTVANPIAKTPRRNTARQEVHQEVCTLSNLERDLETGWKPQRVFRGSTPNIRWISCHASVLEPGKSPHPPHVHAEEEIILPIDGEATFSFANRDKPKRFSDVKAKPGQLFYYPAYAPHTLENTSSRPVSYLMFKWRSHLTPREKPMDAMHHNFSTVAPPDRGRSTRIAKLAEGSTLWLDRLQFHVTEVDPGKGYDPHVDAHDVAIVLLAGEIVTGGRRICAPGVAFFAAGEPHGLHNPTSETARYLVVEFERAA